MGMSGSNRDLVEQIEQLVREHVEATRQAAAAAVERAFSSAAPSRPVRERSKSAGTPKRASSGRRSQAELAALADRLHELVCAQPGETMSVLAPQLGATSVELERPMKALKKAGRVRSVGQRHLTRYFPTVPRPVSSAA